MSKEIDDYIKEMVDNNQGTREQILEQFLKSDDSDLVAYATNAAKPKIEETKKTMMEQFVTPHPMLGISPADVALYGGLAGAAVAGGRKAIDIGGNVASKGFQYAKDKLFEPSAVPPPTSVPTASTQDLMTKPNPLNVYAQEKFNVPLSELEKASGGPIKTVTDLDIIGNTFSKGGGISINPISGSVSNAPSGIPSGNPMNSLTNRPNPYMTPSVQAGVETGNPTPAVQSVIAKELDQATGMYRDAQGNMVYPEKMSPAARSGYEAFTKQYPEISKALEAKGQFAILGAGSGDNNLFNSYNADLAKRLRNEVNEGQMVGPYINYEKKVNPAIKGISPESAIGKELAQLPEIGGNYGQLGTPVSIGGKKGGLIQGTNMVAKAVKAGGPAALLMSLADAANAAQRGNYGEAAFRGLDVATDMIPVVAQMKQGLTPTEVGAPTVSKRTIESAALLGSPYAQTEWAKKQRLKEKAGSSRGIAPPSAYMR